MRSDKQLGLDSRDFAGSNEINWRSIQEGVSHSGHERNCLFLSTKGKQFTDISGISGLDHGGDSRGFALLDYDRDGWLDVALVNSNAPWFQLYHNRIGARAGGEAGRMLAIRFVGGNRTGAPSQTLSNRDGYGALVRLDLGDQSLIREHRCGEGFGTQNSATLHVGIGRRDRVRALEVRWPSGATSRGSNIPAGSLVTVYENPADSPNGSAVVVAAYAPETRAAARAMDGR